MTNDAFRYVLSAEGREIDLVDGEATLGRSRTSTVRLEHESVSRSHALLTLNRGEAIVKDLNSSNG
ncbi:MAG: FHA domain-containing protein, partial [Thermoanaerobaculia bacterium]|nr:FHA domain-containing protein [Thermoanaerobaculia bacterium]